MRYIEKNYTTNAVQTHSVELKAQSLDENSLLNPAIYPGETGRKLWKRVRDIKVIPHFWDLKRQMMDEQGGICCYCGLKIKFDTDRKATVEHLKPKGIYRELVGEYKNLLLCCSLTQDEKEDINNDTVTDNDVKHCDDTKGDEQLNYTPLQADCSMHFSYDITGHIIPTDPDSETDIRTLNLDCPALVDRRKMAMNILFDESGTMLSDEELRLMSDSIMQRQDDGTFREFCFVIKSTIDNLLNP